MSTAKSANKEVKSNIKVEKIKDIDKNEDLEIKNESEDKKDELKFSEREKEYILKIISNGYHIKDIKKKIKVNLKISEKLYKEKIEKINRIEDLTKIFF